MGSPLSPVIANFYMEYYESLALESSQLQPKLWLSYIYDAFVIWQHGEESLYSFPNLLNGIRETGRTLMKRIEEHKMAVRKDDKKNMTVHVTTTKHQMNNWEGSRVISNVTQY